MIEFINLTKIYSNKNEVKAVDNLNLTVNDGEIFGFLGHNGAGKTTTIKMLTGIIKPTDGKVLINGIDIVAEPEKAKREFAYVSDNPDMFLRLTGIEYIKFMADIFEVPEEVRKDRVEKLAAEFEMTHALNSKIASYSHGMRQKIELIASLIHEPKVWILDEPLTGLDPKASYIFKRIMKEHARKGNIVFFSTHVLEVAEKLCDRVGIIKNGKLIVQGTIDEIKNDFSSNSTLENIFMEMTDNEEDMDTY